MVKLYLVLDRSLISGVGFITMKFLRVMSATKLESRQIYARMIIVNVRIHKYCLKAKFSSRNENVCPGCGTQWPYIMAKTEAVEEEEDTDVHQPPPEALARKRLRSLQNTEDEESNGPSQSQPMTQASRRGKLEALEDLDEDHAGPSQVTIFSLLCRGQEKKINDGLCCHDWTSNILSENHTTKSRKESDGTCLAKLRGFILLECNWVHHLKNITSKLILVVTCSGLIAINAMGARDMDNPKFRYSIMIRQARQQLLSSRVQADDATRLILGVPVQITAYADGSGTSGFLVSDLMHLDTVVGDSTFSHASASVVFGCSTTRTGDWTSIRGPVDGIFGLGQKGISVIAQLSSQGVAPNAFCHCLVGNSKGGGILVLGQIIEPSMVYTPLIPSQTHYNVNLLSISVNGQTLSIDPSMFAKSGSQVGTIIDSGTTLVYLPEEAHASFVDAITRSVSKSVRLVTSPGRWCYVATSRFFLTHDMFPNVSLNFAGGASMFLRPQDYLLPEDPEGGAVMWCIGFQANQDLGMTILGDLVLKDKVVVYDLGGQRIGWANYDCTSSVNASTTSTAGRSEHMKAGQIGSSSSWILIVAFGFVIASIS